eukprot:TRINITY_DN73121_c0_g1_i1.p1 TRINITY_DN73121_c0_g1~~TRINITY_DN73121_c0_g1_i1.p1  ORF type:complete len:266 (-),score=54.44 TRINITY_DN73121_c0_g1_i1:238-966(-)
MPGMKSLVVAFFGTASAHWGDFSAEKFQPLVTACDGVDALANCSATFTGVCVTTHHGHRGCGHHHDHHHHGGGLMKMMKGLAHKAGFGHHHDEDGHHDHKHHHWHGHGHHWLKMGDCDTKKDGETCTVAREGRCLPTGKCPVFQGKTVCKPWDMHPPSFVTAPCDGKTDGESCEFMRMPGTCVKAKYDDYVACKTFASTWAHEKMEVAKKKWESFKTSSFADTVSNMLSSKLSSLTGMEIVV